MSKKLFTDRRWTDPPQAKVVGYFEMTEEEKRQAGKDLEKIVLSRAVQKHIERKVLAYKNKTVIFN